MIKISSKIRETLEDKLFKSSIYLGLFIAVIFVIYDALFTGEYIGLIGQVFAIIFFGINLSILLKKNSSNPHRFIFSIVLILIIDYGWITGGGISILSGALFFWVIELILIINSSKFYKYVLMILIINYFILFSLEYFWEFNLSPSYTYNKGNLAKQYVIWFFLFFFGGSLTVFLKVNFNRERINLSLANEELQEKSEEISQQNHELHESKKVLDNTISKLDQQKQELIEVKDSLEEKVIERTNDLLSLNERLLSQNQQLEQYAYITSHNLRAPIAQIKGLVHLLPINNEFDDLTNETLDRLIGSIKNIEKVFDDLSTILNVKNDMQRPWDEVDLAAEIQEIIDTLKPSINEKKIQVDYSHDDPLKIRALRPYVYSVLHNLLENAVKYSDSKKPVQKIEIELKETDAYYVVSIMDNGIGIDLALAGDKIFQMYQRFNDTHPGHGFGLFLVKSQMEAMEGKVELESILGVGTTFNLYFPKR